MAAVQLGFLCFGLLWLVRPVLLWPDRQLVVLRPACLLSFFNLQTAFGCLLGLKCDCLGLFGCGLCVCLALSRFRPLSVALSLYSLVQCADCFRPLRFLFGIGCRSLGRCAGRSFSLGFLVRLGRFLLSGLLLRGSLGFAPCL